MVAPFGKERQARGFEAELTSIESMTTDCDEDEMSAEDAKRIVEDLIGFKVDSLPKSVVKEALLDALDEMSARLNELGD